VFIPPIIEDGVLKLEDFFKLLSNMGKAKGIGPSRLDVLEKGLINAMRNEGASDCETITRDQLIKYFTESEDIYEQIKAILID
jgi:hypothetical protein